jgi:hypothetical protein
VSAFAPLETRGRRGKGGCQIADTHAHKQPQAPQSTAEHGMVRQGRAEHGMAWHGMAWHGMAWHGRAGQAREPHHAKAGEGHGAQLGLFIGGRQAMLPGHQLLYVSRIPIILKQLGQRVTATKEGR